MSLVPTPNLNSKLSGTNPSLAAQLFKMMKKWVVSVEYSDTSSNPTVHTAPLPLAEKVVFSFTTEAYCWAYTVRDENNDVMWQEAFQGAPFHLPPAGGSVEISLANIELGGVRLGDILDSIESERQKETKRRVRSIDDPWESL